MSFLPHPFVVPLTTAQFKGSNNRSSRVIPPQNAAKPLPPYRFFFSSTGVQQQPPQQQNMEKFKRVPKDQLFPEEKTQKENIQPLQEKVHQKMYKKNKKQRWFPRKNNKTTVNRRVYNKKKFNYFPHERTYNIGPIALDGTTNIEFSFTIKKK